MVSQSQTRPRRSDQPSFLTVPRVKNERELRPGHEVLGCPSCNHNVWVSPTQMRLLEVPGSSLTCRECQQGALPQ